MKSAMRGVTILGLVAAFGLALSEGSRAAVISWLDDVGTLPSAADVTHGPAAPGNPVVNLPTPTSTGSLWIWLHNDAKLQSVAYNIQTATPGKIKFTGAQVFNYDLIVGPPVNLDINDRWNTPLANGTISPDGQTITNMSAVNVDKAGLDPSTRNLDQGWDQAAGNPLGSGAALFARIDFMNLGSPQGGSTDIQVAMGSVLIVEGGTVPQTTFFGATVNAAPGVPEPASLALAGLGLFGVVGVASRRRGK